MGVPLYYHGGMPGLKKDSVLLSHKAAVAEGMTSMFPGAWGGRPGGAYSPDRVYFTTDIDLARSFAHSLRTDTGRGHLYEVKPRGRVEVDPDYAIFDDVFMAPSAVVTCVLEQNIRLTRAEENRPFATRARWTGGGHYVNSFGFVLPSPGMKEAGWTAEALQLLPQWLPRADLEAELSQLAVSRPGDVLSRAPEVGHAERAVAHAAIGLSLQAIEALQVAHDVAQQTMTARDPADLRGHANARPVEWLRRVFNRSRP